MSCGNWINLVSQLSFFAHSGGFEKQAKPAWARILPCYSDASLAYAFRLNGRVLYDTLAGTAQAIYVPHVCMYLSIATRCGQPRIAEPTRTRTCGRANATET